MQELAVELATVGVRKAGVLVSDHFRKLLKNLKLQFLTGKLLLRGCPFGDLAVVSRGTLIGAAKFLFVHVSGFRDRIFLGLV